MTMTFGDILVFKHVRDILVFKHVFYRNKKLCSPQLETIPPAKVAINLTAADTISQVKTPKTTMYSFDSSRRQSQLRNCSLRKPMKARSRIKETWDVEPNARSTSLWQHHNTIFWQH